MTSKQCNKCKLVKEVSEFFKDKSHSSGYYSICKACKTTATYSWRTNNRTTYNKGARKWRSKNKGKYRAYNLKKKFGLTLNKYKQMFNEQEGKCLICHTHQKDLKRALAVDHCHDSLMIRGLLCDACNLGLGYFQSNSGYIERALEYLLRGKGT